MRPATLAETKKKLKRKVGTLEQEYKSEAGPKVDAGKALKSRVVVQLHIGLVQTRLPRQHLANNPIAESFAALAMQE